MNSKRVSLERERERERMRILMERMTMMLYIIVGARGCGQRLFFLYNYFDFFFLLIFILNQQGNSGLRGRVFKSSAVRSCNMII